MSTTTKVVSKTKHRSWYAGMVHGSAVVDVRIGKRTYRVEVYLRAHLPNEHYRLRLEADTRVLTKVPEKWSGKRYLERAEMPWWEAKNCRSAWAIKQFGTRATALKNEGIARLRAVAAARAVFVPKAA